MMRHEPTLAIEAVVPETEHMEGVNEANCTARPELAVAERDTFVPTVWLGIAGKAMYWRRRPLPVRPWPGDERPRKESLKSRLGVGTLSEVWAKTAEKETSSMPVFRSDIGRIQTRIDQKY